MSNSGGKIYSEVVNGVKVGINTDDVSSVLGVASHDIKTLCTSSKINPAAVFRPRFMGGAVHVDPEDFQSNLKSLVAPASGATGITMKCVNYGIWVPYFNTLLNGRPWDASHVRWNPRPCDDTQFGDLTHFDGYNHNVTFENPVKSVVCGNNAYIQVTFQDISTKDTITARTLFGDNEDAYFGFIVYEFTGDGPVLSGTGAVIPKAYIHNYQLMQSTYPQVVSSDFKARKGYGYDIIPIVAVDTGGEIYDYYSLFISDSVPGFIRKYIGTNDIEFIYFRFSEGTFYPDGNTIETGSSIGVDKTTFGFALMMTSPFPKILADSDTAYSTGLIRPGTIKLTAKFTRMSDNQTFTKVFTENDNLVVQRQLNTNILRMYIKTTSTGNAVYDWARTTAGSLAGKFDFDIAFTINVNTTGGSEKNSFPAQSWMRK